jgi:hypothetical protein
MPVQEVALEGWDELDQYLGRRTTPNQKEKLRSAGIIFNRVIGFGSNRKRKIFTFPSLLQRFLLENPNF